MDTLKQEQRPPKRGRPTDEELRKRGYTKKQIQQLEKQRQDKLQAKLF